MRIKYANIANEERMSFMRVLVVSDIHGSGVYADKLKEIIKKEKPEKIIVLGDLYEIKRVC